MQSRLKYRESSPEGFAPMRQLNAYIENCGIEHSLLELVSTHPVAATLPNEARC